jgi:hypothetical protein
LLLISFLEIERDKEGTTKLENSDDRSRTTCDNGIGNRTRKNHEQEGASDSLIENHCNVGRRHNGFFQGASYTIVEQQQGNKERLETNRSKTDAMVNAQKKISPLL